MTDITFGPQGQEWHYSKLSKTYDLSGDSMTKLTFPTTEGPKETSILISPESSALVVVDMQNFFLHSKCKDHPNGLNAVEPTITVIEKCRETGIQIIWLNWGVTDEDMKTMPASVQRGFLKGILQPESADLRFYVGLGSDLGDSKGRCLFAGSWNAELYPPLKAHVKPDDIHCSKNRMSGLWTPGQPLWKALKSEMKSTILFAGVNTDQCVLGTLVDAYNAGWNCVLIDDCCGTTTVGGKEVSFHNISSSYGFVTNSASFVNAK